MVEKIIPYFHVIFQKCAQWFTQLINAVGGSGVLLTALCLALAIGLLFMPLRGEGLGTFNSMTDYTANRLHKPSRKGRYSNSRSLDVIPKGQMRKK